MENQENQKNIDQETNLDEQRINALNFYIDRLLATIKVDPKFNSYRNKERMILDAEDLVNASLMDQAESKPMDVKLIKLLRKTVKSILTFEFKAEQKKINPYAYFDNLLSQIIIEKASLEQKKTFDDLSADEQEEFVKANLTKLEPLMFSEPEVGGSGEQENGREFENILKEMFYNGSISLSVVLKEGLLSKDKRLTDKSNFLVEFLEDKIKKPIYLKRDIKFEDLDWSIEIKKLRDPKISFSIFKDVLSNAASVNLIYPGGIDDSLNFDEPLVIRASRLATLLEKRLESKKIAQERLLSDLSKLQSEQENKTDV